MKTVPLQFAREEHEKIVQIAFEANKRARDLADAVLQYSTGNLSKEELNAKAYDCMRFLSIDDPYFDEDEPARESDNG